MISVELYSEAFHDAFVGLLCDVHEHYHGVQPERDTVSRHLSGNILSPASPLEICLAIDETGAAVGFAAIYLVHSLVEPYPGDNRQCHLKELFVQAEQRGQGAGERLMHWVANYALKQGCGRVDWPVKATNLAGKKFYERLGARQVADRLSYRLDGDGLQALAR